MKRDKAEEIIRNKVALADEDCTVSPALADRLWERLDTVATVKPAKKIMLYWPWAAAILLVIVSTAFILMHKERSNDIVYLKPKKISGIATPIIIEKKEPVKKEVIAFKTRGQKKPKRATVVVIHQKVNDVVDTLSTEDVIRELMKISTPYGQVVNELVATTTYAEQIEELLVY